MEKKAARMNLDSARGGNPGARRRLEGDLREWILLMEPQPSVTDFAAKGIIAFDNRDPEGIAETGAAVRRFGEERWQKVLELAGRNDAGEEGASNALLGELLLIGRLIASPGLRPRARRACRALLQDPVSPNNPDAQRFLEWIEAPDGAPMTVH